MELKAYGKINLALDVTGKRSDGYHLVKMVMQTVNIYDLVRVKCQDADKTEINLSITDPSLPSDENNIAWKAAELVLNETGRNCNVVIDIQKNIPCAAGMAGGSADAAAVIDALDYLLDLNLSLEKKDEIALKLGADVPFCLRRGTWLSEGIGEILTKLPDFPICHVLVVNPGFDVSTKWVYTELDSKEEIAHPDIDGLCSEIEKSDLKAAVKKMENVLETVTIFDYPEIKKIKEEMLERGALGSMMTGSGPTVFGVFESLVKAQKALDYFNSKGFDKSYVTSLVNDKEQ